MDMIRNLLRKAKAIIKQNLGEFMDRLLLLLFGIGLGVKIIVTNHQLDPRELNLDLMAADYILILAAPFLLMLFTKLLNRVMPPDDQPDWDDEAADQLQTSLNEILDDVTTVYTSIEDITDEDGIVKSSDLIKANLKPL